MKKRVNTAIKTGLLFCAIAGLSTMALAQQGRTRDPLAFLKRAITEANAPALTADEETQLTTLITNFRQAQPHGPNQQLLDARKAYNNAVLAGDLDTAQTQAGIISGLMAAQSRSGLTARAKFDTDALAALKNGGQLDALAQKFGNQRVLMLIGSLAGHPFGGERFGGGRPGFSPGGGFGPGLGFAGRESHKQ